METWQGRIRFVSDIVLSDYCALLLYFFVVFDVVMLLYLSNQWGHQPCTLSLQCVQRALKQRSMLQQVKSAGGRIVAVSFGFLVRSPCLLNPGHLRSAH